MFGLVKSLFWLLAPIIIIFFCWKNPDVFLGPSTLKMVLSCPFLGGSWFPFTSWLDEIRQQNPSAEISTPSGWNLAETCQFCRHLPYVRRKKYDSKVSVPCETNTNLLRIRDSHVFHQLLPFLAPNKPQRPRCLHSGRGLRLWRRGDRLGDLGDLGDSVAEWIRCLNHSNYTGHIL